MARRVAVACGLARMSGRGMVRVVGHGFVWVVWGGRMSMVVAVVSADGWLVGLVGGGGSGWWCGVVVGLVEQVGQVGDGLRGR